MTRTRLDFAEKLSGELGISKPDAKHIVDQFLNCLQEFLIEGDTIAFRGLCSMKVVQRAAKVGLNPQNPDDGLFLIPPRKVVKFTAGVGLHEALNPDLE